MTPRSRRLEKGLIHFPRHFHGEPIRNVDRALKLLKAYRLDDNGKPVKKDDHCPDALMAGVLRWAPNRYVKPRAW